MTFDDDCRSTPTFNGPRRASAAAIAAWLTVALAVLASRQVSAEQQSAHLNDGQVLIKLDYNPATLYAGSNNCRMSLSVESASAAPPRVKAVSGNDDTFRAARFTRLGGKAGAVFKDSYDLFIDLQPAAAPRRHNLIVEFERNGHRGDTRASLTLPVGVVKAGMLKIEAKETDLAGGGGRLQRSFRLLLSNDFPEYPVYVKQLDFSVTPDYLVELAEVKGARVTEQGALFDPPLIIHPSQKQALPVKLAIRPVRLGDALGGLNQATMSIGVAYSDEGGRNVSDLTIDRTVRVGPPVWLTIIAILIGLALGTLIATQVYLADASNRRQQAIISNVAAAVLLIAMVVWGKIELGMFDKKWSYDSAGMLFVLSGLCAFGGMPFLKKVCKIPDGARGAAVLLVLAFLGLRAAPALAVGRSSSPAPGPRESAQASLEKGLFYLNGDDVTDLAARYLRGALRDERQAPAEDAQYFLGCYYQRKFYIGKERNKQTDWAALDEAERAYRQYLKGFAARGRVKWLGETHFGLALIQIERGKLDRVGIEADEMLRAAARDARTYVYQVTWSPRPASVIDFWFPTAYLASALKSIRMVGRRPPDVVADLVSTLKGRKVQSQVVKPPLTAVAQPRATVNPLPKGPGGQQRFRFTVSLSLPEARRAEVAKVVYRFEHPSFGREKDMSSAEAPKDFSVSYDGWGALDEVLITLYARDGHSEVLNFRMLAALGWE